MSGTRVKVSLVAGLALLGLPAPALFASNPEPIVCSLPAQDYMSRELDAAGDESLAGGNRILRFANLSDTHIIDDEASAAITGNVTETALDPSIGNNAAQRLQEEYTDEVLNAMVRTLNVCDAEDPLEFMIATGDLTDNSTLNELRRYIDNLDGTFGHDTAFEANCGYVTRDSNGQPKAGAPATCPIPADVLELPTGKLVTDSQSPPPDPFPTDDPTWGLRPAASARQIANALAASVEHGSHTTAPGLPDQLACDSSDASCTNEKLATDHYAAFGNHDGYARGTVTFQQAFQAGSLAFGRYFLESQREFINEYFFTTGTPVGHGFNFVDPARFGDNDDRNDGYYAYDAGTDDDVRIIVLNTIADGVVEEVHGDGQVNSATGGHLTGNEVTNPIGLEMGVMDAEQFSWLEAELAAAGDRPVLVFSHHPDLSFSETRLGFPANGPSGKTAVEVDEALGEHGNVVAWIAGHTHLNRIRPCADGDCEVGGDQPDIAHPFWRVETASLVDYPQESRIVELFELATGGYGLRLTQVLPDPNDPLASRSRELSILEENCSTASMLGGPMSSGPYDQARLATVAGNVQAAATNDEYCAGDVVNNPKGPQGEPKDRDTILLP